MEPNQVVNEEQKPVSDVGKDVVFRDKPKKNMGVVLGMVFLALLAIGGIGFGVWAMMDGNSQKEQLNLQISDLKKQNSELQSKSDSDVDGDVVVDADIENDSVISTEYIYVGEWGLKIKKGDNLKILRMDYYDAKPGSGADYLSIAVSFADGFSEASNLYNGPNGSIYPYDYIVRTKDSEFDPHDWGKPLKPVYNDGEYNYFTFQPTGFATEGISNSELLIKAYNELFEKLTIQSNYSKI